MTIKEHIEWLNRCYPDQDRPIVAIVWVEEDIYWKVSEMGLPEGIIDRDGVADIFDTLERRHDASLGINWDSIEWGIENYLEENNLSPERIFPEED